MMMVCSSTTMRSSSRRFTCRSPWRGLVEEAHEIVTGTTRAHTSSPRTVPGNTDHADIVHLPDTRGARPPLRVGGSDIHRTGSFSRGWPMIRTYPCSPAMPRPPVERG